MTKVEYVELLNLDIKKIYGIRAEMRTYTYISVVYFLLLRGQIRGLSIEVPGDY